jgi:CRP-like cAMP-binding protein
MAQKVQHYQNSERIISAGSRDRCMYIILEGSVRITLGEGDTMIKVAELSKGDFFGEISLFNNTPRSATVYATGDVKLASIDSVEDLKSFLVRNPAYAAKMVHILASRLAKTDELLVGKISEINRMKVTRDL